MVCEVKSNGLRGQVNLFVRSGQMVCEVRLNGL